MGQITVPGRPLLRAGLLFVAIVWSIAAACLAIQTGLDAMASILGRWSPEMMTGTQSLMGQRRCQQLVRTLPPPVTRKTSDGLSTLTAWSLGLQFGYAMGERAVGGISIEDTSLLIERLQCLSSALSVPVVHLPETVHSALILRDFTAYVQEDPECVAAALERRFSARHSALYRFGATVGFATVFWNTRQSPDELEPHIASYGNLAGIPPDFLRAIKERRKDSNTLQQEVMRIDTYLKNKY